MNWDSETPWHADIYFQTFAKGTKLGGGSYSKT